jgi:hypothetical protein
MADPTLHGNGWTCPACELRREVSGREIAPGRLEAPCNACGGSGRIARPVSEIIEHHAAQAALHYWPERDRAFARHNAAKRARST